MMAEQLEMIAITGMACRFPGAASLADFWTALREGRDATSPVPAQRWDTDAFFDAESRMRGKTNCRTGGFIPDVDRFDAAFFGISPREATQMDPQQRILLELTYEALEDAGIAPVALAGTDAAVFVGAMTNDYLRHQFDDEYRRIDVHTGSGAGLCMLANRLSYQFDLRGLSAAVDTACSSSLVAVFQACQALWTGQSRLAIAAGVNVMLDPALNVFYAKAGLSAPDGRCKTFSASADGIGRAEGAGVVVLKRLSDALSDGDPVYAVIRGGAVNHDGRSNGLTQPNRWAQEQLLRRAFEQAGIARNDLGYIELHGTGTLIGDPIEANALGAVLAEQGQRDACLVGSVKTNFGHLEAAAGIAGLIKLALSIAHGEIPPSLWFDAPNPHIAFDRLPIRVNTQLTPWAQRNGRRVGGISSFGLGGTNAHLVLESPPQPKGRVIPASPATEHWLFLSARSEAALQALAGTYVEFLGAAPESDLPLICSTALRRKGIHEFRLSVFGGSAAQLVDGLQAFVSGLAHPAVVQGRYRPSHRGLVLVLAEHSQIEPRQLSQWIAAAPIAREAWNACRVAVRDILCMELPPLDTLASHANVAVDDPAFRGWHFAAQYSLLQQVIASVPATPMLVADGLGQLAAFCAAGALSLNSALQWLAAGLSKTFWEREPQSRYAIDCDCSSALNPSLTTIDWSAARPWHERLGSRVDPTDADVVLINLSELDRSSATTAVLALGNEPGGVNRVIAQLSLRHPLAGAAAAADLGFIRLPAYPWQRESFWLGRDGTAVVNAASKVVTPAPITIDFANATHALLGLRSNSPTPAWDGCLSAKWLPYLPDHRVQGMTVLPGAGYVELGLAVHYQMTGHAQGMLQDLMLHKALVVDGNEPLLRVTYDEDTHGYAVYSQRRHGDKWELHARGKLASLPPVTPDVVDLAAIQQRCTHFTDGVTHYRDMLERGFEYGPYFQGMRSLWLDDAGEEVLAWIEGHEQLTVAEHGNCLHPTLLDASLQSLLTPLRMQGDTELYIPTGIRELKLHSVPKNGFWCHGRLARVAPGIVEGEATLFDAHGVVVAEASGVRAQALTQKERDELRQIDQWLYEYVWESSSREPVQPRAGRWLLFADRDAAADILEEQLARGGAEETIRVSPSAVFEKQSATQYGVVRGSKADLQRVLREAGANGIAGIAYLWGLDAPDDEHALIGAATPIISAVHLLQAISRECAANPPELVVVTRGAQSVQSQPLDNVMQSALIGLVRVAVNEYPAVRLRAVDIDRDTATVAHLAAEILGGGVEDEVALRGPQRFVHRMVRKPEADLGAATPPPIDKPFQSGTHLITGGFGGFGLKIAEWMVAQGARHLVLVGRHGASQPQAQRAIAKLRERGAEVIAVAADISKEADVANLIERIRDQLPPLRGVFHAAATLDDAPIEHIEHRQIDNAMSAKAVGAWHLHRYTLDAQLDYFVLFSSIASLLGGAGQASYAMSCMCLDALAQFRRARNLPAISINWGALAQVGMATRHADAEKHLGRTGVGSFTPSQAVKMFARVLQWNPVALGVAMMDWKSWGATYPAWAASPKFGALVVKQEDAPSAQTTLLHSLAGLAQEDRVAAICTVLVAMLATIVETTPEEIDPDISLISLGVDSLMALDLQAAIEKDFAFKISTLELMKGNSLAALAQQLAQRIGETTHVAAGRAVGVLDVAQFRQRALLDAFDIEDAEKIIAQLEDLGDAELDGLLAELTGAEETLQ